MPDAPLIVGVSGLRGIVGQSLTPEVAVRYAGAFGAWLHENVASGRRAFVLVGRDGRAGGEAIESAVIATLLSSGVRVHTLGTVMTPSVGVAADAMGCDGAVIITASHNPQAWNGIKLLISEDAMARDGESDARGTPGGRPIGCCAPSARHAAEIIGRFEAGASRWVAGPDTGSITWDPDAAAMHCLAVKRAVEAHAGVSWRSLLQSGRARRVVTDSVNASSAEPDRSFFASGPVECVQLGASPSGIFPHPPEPTAENLSGEGGLRDAVPGLKADIGFAQDPDADRLAIVDETGRYIGEEYTLALCAESLLSAETHRRTDEQTKTPVLVANLSTSRMIDDVATRYGGRVVRTPVGEANVVEVMKKLRREGEDVVLGGEGNGGVIWPEVVYVRDSLSAMALVLSLMARTGKTVSQLVEQINADSPGGNGYAIVKRKTPIATSADAAPAVETVAAAYAGRDDAAVDRQDGVRVDLPDQGLWVHVRASNTEPIMRLIAEAPTEADAARILDEVERLIAG